MKILSFELTMPNVGSWNGKWTGADRKYYIIRTVDNKTGNEIMKDAKQYPIYEGFFERKQVGLSNLKKGYYYNFGDGWGASVEMELIDSKTAAKRRKISCGFSGYDWMVDSIMVHGDILSTKQIKELHEKEILSIP